MISDMLFRVLKSEMKHLPKDIDHFSIEKVGSKFYVYAHPFEKSFNKKKIGTYADYETAKKVVDSILDMKLPTDI